MEVNDQVVGQGIVVLSILAGFSFAISAELLMRDNTPRSIERSAVLFSISGILSIFSSAMGMMYFSSVNDIDHAEVGRGFIMFFLFSVFVFVGFFLSMLMQRIRDAFWRRIVRDIAIYCLIALFIVASIIVIKNRHYLPPI